MLSRPANRKMHTFQAVIFLCRSKIDPLKLRELQASSTDFVHNKSGGTTSTVVVVAFKKPLIMPGVLAASMDLYRFYRARFPRGTSLIGKSVRDYFRTKGFIRICDGFFLKTKGFLPKVYEVSGSEMPLEHYCTA